MKTKKRLKILSIVLFVILAAILGVAVLMHFGWIDPYKVMPI